MTDPAEDHPQDGGFRLGVEGFRNIAREVAQVLVHLAILLAMAGRIDWINAWVAAALGLGNVAVNTALMLKYNPRIIIKRARLVQEGTKPFDKVFIVIFLALTFALSIVAGLDAGRFGWSHMPLWLNVTGVLIYIPACALGNWAMAVNRHFETTVIIRGDGSQKVISTGPYRYVRHPGYTATMFGAIGYPLILGSWWCLALVGLYAAIFIIRTILEDRALHKELPGYEEYSAKTRYRLLPYVW